MGFRVGSEPYVIFFYIEDIYKSKAAKKLGWKEQTASWISQQTSIRNAFSYNKQTCCGGRVDLIEDMLIESTDIKEWLANLPNQLKHYWTWWVSNYKAITEYFL